MHAPQKGSDGGGGGRRRFSRAAAGRDGRLPSGATFRSYTWVAAPPVSMFTHTFNNHEHGSAPAPFRGRAQRPPPCPPPRFLPPGRVGRGAGRESGFRPPSLHGPGQRRGWGQKGAAALVGGGGGRRQFHPCSWRAEARGRNRETGGDAGGGGRERRLVPARPAAPPIGPLPCARQTSAPRLPGPIKVKGARARDSSLTGTREAAKRGRRRGGARARLGL